VPRSYVACDRCGFGTWIGARGDQVDAWCEACQQPAVLCAPVDAHAGCPRCGERLSFSAPKFEELYGELQNLVAVLEAWLGRPGRLQPLVPERPRFLTDLNPPPRLPWDSHDLQQALDALIAGAFHEAGERLGRIALPDTANAELRLRVAMGLGIVHQRLGDPVAAEAAFDRAIAADPGNVAARLDRGALRGRRGDFAGAWEDFTRTGDSYEAGWNRAATMVLEAVNSAGIPDAERIRAARLEAGAPNDYWSDPTVGRLLFTHVVERFQSGLERSPDGGAAVLRAAEAEVEFDGFTDRAMVLLGYLALGIELEWARIAHPLALGVIENLREAPFVHGVAGRDLFEALAQAAAAVTENAPARALEAVAGFAERSDLRRYRIPCNRCGTGSIGVEQVVEADEEAGVE